ncbi:hypothetical protein B5K08_23810 [Rhizobium leguminosarum bv. trifolii]|uniref:Uncharacterized protein n=2 Tax=Rhizobium TaxID=379 RepID=A0A3E1B665_RHILT|nr:MULTISPECIES: hypothetical protein [Rhizobium]KPH04389.1 hypothetical protein AOG23_33320 [Rhizobium acidisoli]QAS80879.1 hypothetical protein CO657_22825 [Rhizobium acidisoli]RFB86366.1 hypothetical protein B5K08_23810 [Rhizobium leguminosarum bv. trifolii]RFB86624.1 hypothetical protein B5K10_23795 [Rhizobium leguminosarum bv. trifolii]
MAVDAVNSDLNLAPANPVSVELTTDKTGSTSTTGSTTKKVDPNSESEVLSAAVDAFLPGMISNTLMLNNSLFNFAKEAIDEGSDE